ncbi:unnamed protein product, partial [marine sediment metagenome]
MRELVKLPNSLLRQRSEPVESIDSEVRSLAKEMVEFMQTRRDQLIPVGLAAPQLGEL